MIDNYGILGIIHLAIVIWVVLNVAQSSATNLAKVLWILFVLFLPVIGVIVWFFAGPRGKR
jgi:hypothetical protein